MAFRHHTEDIKVVKHKPVLVVPAEPTPEHVVLLPHVNVYSLLDLGQIYTSHIHAFKADPYGSEEKPAQVIRRALEKILVVYYPFAGRIRATKHGNLEVVCNAAGVVFVEAHAKATLAELSKTDRSYWAHPQDDVPVKNFVNVPPLVVQVTELLCGSFVLAVGIFESLSDPDRTLQFINEWAEIARGQKRMSIVPVWGEKEMAALEEEEEEHRAFKYGTHGPQAPREVTTSLSRFEKQDSLGKTKYAKKESVGRLEKGIEKEEGLRRFGEQRGRYHVEEYESMARNHIGAVSDDPRREFASITLIDIPIESVVSLKKQLLLEGRSKFTSFEALAAHVWRERTRALRLPFSHEVKLFFLSDVCYKSESHLPRGLYGQHAFNCQAVTRAGELVGKPLVYGVELIQAAKRSLEREFARCVEAMEEAFASEERHAGVLFFTEFSKMNVREVDFGWGQAEWVVSGGARPGEMIEPGGVNVAGLARRSMDYDSIYLVMNNVPVTRVEDLKARIRDPITSFLTSKL